MWVIPMLSLVSGNYAYQLMLANPDMLVATERSYFQVIAVLVTIGFDRLFNRV
jgi:hypothetical protein